MRPIGRDQKKASRKVPTITVDERTARQIFGGNVVHRREQLGFTRAECAQGAGVEIAVLIALEAGDGEPGAFTVAAIAQFLRCRPDYLMGDLYWIPSPDEGGRGHFELD